MRHKMQRKATGQPTLPPSREHDGVVDGHGDQPELEDLVKSIIMTCDNPARVLELFYFSQEPGGLQLIRSIMALPAQGRAALRSFLSRAPDPQEISVRLDSRGRVTLRAVHGYREP